MAAYPTINLNDSVPAAPADAIAVKWQSAVSSHDADILNVSGAVQGDGNTTHFLRGDGTFATPPSGLSNPMTTEGDIIIENATPAPDRLPIGTTGEVLTVVSGLPAWQAPASSLRPFKNIFNTSTSLLTDGTDWLNFTGGTVALGAGSNGSQVIITISQEAVGVGNTFAVTFSGDNGAYGTLTWTSASITAVQFGTATLVYGPNGWCVISMNGATLT